MSARPPKAPMFRPPPMTLPKQVRSASMPYSSWAPPRATRKPVMTSSKISSAPTRSHSARSAARKPSAGGDEAHVGGDGLEDDRGDVVGEGGDVVEGHDRGVGHRGRRDPHRVGQAEDRQRRTGLGQEGVAVAVVVAGELHQPVAAGVAAGEADGRHRRLGARAHQPDLLHRRDASADLLGQQDLPLGGRAIARAPGRGVLDGGDDGGVGVAGDDRPVALDEIEVLGALDVPDPCAVGALDEVRGAPDGAEGPDGRVDAAGDPGLGPGVERGVGPGCASLGHCCSSAMARAA